MNVIGLDLGNRQNKARLLVLTYIQQSDTIYLNGKDLSVDDIYVVWFSKTLQNWKALVSTNLADGVYYEVTYNGDKAETYLDVYQKVENLVVPD